MSGFGRPIAEVPGRGASLEYLRTLFADLDKNAAVRDASKFVESKFPSSSRASYLEKLKRESNSSSIQSATIAVVVADTDSFHATLDAIQTCLTQQRLGDLSLANAFVYFPWMDSRPSFHQNEKAMASIPHSLVLLSSWLEPAVFRQYPTVHQLYGARGGKYIVSFIAPTLEDSILERIEESPSSTGQEIANAVRCQPTAGTLPIADANQYQGLIDVGGPSSLGDLSIKLKSSLLSFILERLVSRLQAACGDQSIPIPIIEARLSGIITVAHVLRQENRHSEYKEIVTKLMSPIFNRLTDRHPASFVLRKELGASRRLLQEPLPALALLQGAKDQILSTLAEMQQEPVSDDRNTREAILMVVLVDVLQEQGAVHRDLSDTANSRQSYQMALEIGQSIQQERLPLSQRNSLHVLLRKLEVTNAELTGDLESLVEVHRRYYGEQSTEHWSACRNLGLKQLKDHRYSAAAETLYRAYEIACSLPSMGRDHLLTTSCLQHHARALIKAGDFQTGLERLQECLAIRQRTLGNDDGHTINAMQYIAEELRNHGRPTDALACYEECLQRRVRLFQRDQSKATDLIVTLKSMAALAQELNQIAKATEYAGQAFQFAHLHLGPEAALTQESAALYAGLQL